MIKALKNPTLTDKRALAVFFGIALLCALYFASGILVSYVSPPADFIEMSRDGTGYTVRVLNIPTFDGALELSNALREQRRLQAVIEASPTDRGYLLKIGPLATRQLAEQLASELRTTGYDQIGIAETAAGETAP